MCGAVQRGCLIVCLAFALTPRIGSAWTLLGTVGDEISFPAEVFIDPNSVEDLGERQLLVKTLNVYPHTIAGIDFFDQAGGHVYDRSLPHRSYVLIAVYDCTRRMTANVRITYYSGVRAAPETEVYDLVEDDVLFIGQYLGMPSESLIFDTVCDPKELQEFDLLSRNYTGQGTGTNDQALYMMSQ